MASLFFFFTEIRGIATVNAESFWVIDEQTDRS